MSLGTALALKAHPLHANHTQKSSPAVRFAPVGMTSLLQNRICRRETVDLKDEFSSRPERTARAPFREEGRMKLTESTKFNRKSGGA
jgi:hypothetical protein